MIAKGTKVLILDPSGYNLGRLHVDELYGVVQRTKEGKAELFLYFAEEPYASEPATLAAVEEPIPSNIKEAKEEQKKGYGWWFPINQLREIE